MSVYSMRLPTNRRVYQTGMFVCLLQVLMFTNFVDVSIGLLDLFVVEVCVMCEVAYKMG